METFLNYGGLILDGLALDSPKIYSGTTLLPEGISGKKRIKAWAAGGGGGGGDNNVSSPNPGGGSGSSGAFIDATYVLDALKRYVVTAGPGGGNGSNGTNGGQGGTGGGPSGLLESGSFSRVDANTTDWAVTTGSVTRTDNGDGTWNWVFPASTNVSVAFSASNIPAAAKVLMRARIKHNSGTKSINIGWTGQNQTLSGDLITGSYVIVEKVVWSSQGAVDLTINLNSTATPPDIDIDWVEFAILDWVVVAGAGAGGGGGSNGNTAAVGGGASAPCDHSGSGGTDGPDGGGTNGGDTGHSATPSAVGTGGTGHTGTDGVAGTDSMGGPSIGTTGTTMGGTGSGSNGTTGGGPGGGGGGQFGGGSGEKSPDQNSGPGGGGGGSSDVVPACTNVSSTAGNPGIVGVNGGAAVAGGAAVNTTDPFYSASASGKGGDGGGVTNAATDGTDGRVVLIPMAA